MTTKQQQNAIGMSSRMALGVAANLRDLHSAGAGAGAGLGRHCGRARAGYGGGEPVFKEGFAFTEGPVGTADGGVYFTDIRNNRVHHMWTPPADLAGAGNSNGANGLALTKDGELVMAEGAGKRITKRSKDGTITTLTEGVLGMPLMAPNDLITDARGGVYFTDPAPFPPVPGRTAYVYYLTAGAKTPVVIDNQIPLPTGRPP